MEESLDGVHLTSRGTTVFVSGEGREISISPADDLESFVSDHGNYDSLEEAVTASRRILKESK